MTAIVLPPLGLWLLHGGFGLKIVETREWGGLMLTLARGGGGALTPDRFVLPFLVIGAVTLAAGPVYRRLKSDAGAAMRPSRAA